MMVRMDARQHATCHGQLNELQVVQTLPQATQQLRCLRLEAATWLYQSAATAPCKDILTGLSSAALSQQLACFSPGPGHCGMG